LVKGRKKQVSIYEIKAIENAIERIAEQNEGLIPDSLLRELVEKEMGAIASITKMCKYIRHLEMYEKTCKDEETRIKDLRAKATMRRENIKRHMTPFVKDKGKFTAGTFQLSVRKSEFVMLNESFADEDYMIQKPPPPPQPDKMKIKKALKDGEKIPGALLKTNDNLQIK
jgi:hypothetical protein